MAEVRKPVTDDEASKITRVEELAYELSISEVMTKNLIKISPEDTIRDVLDLFAANHISGAPVTSEDDTLLGILSIGDLIRCLRDGRVDLSVNDYMTRDPVTMREAEPVVEALKVFVKTRLGRLPIIDDNNKIVGLLTKGDITNGLLHALQKDYEAEELIRYRASHIFEDIVSDRSTLILRYNVKKNDYMHGGAASNHIKRALLRLGAKPEIARKCGIAAYEAEMNLIIHTNHGGFLRVEIESHMITIEAYDDGPGIPDIEKALTPGFSTASDEVHTYGFGAGMGLVNIKGCVDDMSLTSSPERGTNLKMGIYF